MQQRQPRLGDILDDYCPRERRLTNHAVVAMIGDEIKQTRCTTCESEHEYKHARVPRQRKKPEQSTLYSQVLAAVTPKKAAPLAGAVHPADIDEAPDDEIDEREAPPAPASAPLTIEALFGADSTSDEPGDEAQPPVEEGPLHRRLIRAQLPRHEGQVVIARKEADFTIRQPAPAGRPNRFRQRPAQQQQQQRGAAPFHGNRPGGGNANGNRAGGGGQRQNGRPQQGGGRQGQRHGSGRNRPK